LELPHFVEATMASDEMNAPGRKVAKFLLRA
jgi:hypothetical protein